MGFELYYKLLFCASVWLRVKTCPEMSGRSTRALAALSFQWTRSREISSGLLSLSQRSGGANFYWNSKLGAKSNLLSKVQRPGKRLSFKSMIAHLERGQVQGPDYLRNYVSLTGQNWSGLSELHTHSLNIDVHYKQFTLIEPVLQYYE